MTPSSWPIVFAVLGLVVAAFWYDAQHASISTTPVQMQAPAQ